MSTPKMPVAIAGGGLVAGAAALPVTGSPIATLIVVALGLIVAGGLLIRSARYERPRHQRP